ncbi:MAG: DUF4406 domain-containing protein [Rhodospirillaceae bacterium]
MKLVYVAGPYRATTVWGVEQNILAAQAVGAQVLAIDGLHPVIPHMNTRQMEGIASDEQVLEGTLEMLRRCDAVIIDGRWDSSAGTRGEVAEALRLGLPILYAWGDESYSAGILRDLAATPAGYRVPPGACDPQRERFWMGRRAGADEMLIRLGPSTRPRP